MHHIGFAPHARVGLVGLVALTLSTAAAAQEADQDRLSDIELRLDAIEEDTDDSYGMVSSYGDVTVSFKLFGDVGVVYSDPAPSGKGSTSGTIGTVDAFVSAQIGDNFQVLSESVLTESDAGGTFGQERLWGAWTFDDRLYAKLGLEHSPLTLWSRRYHHGAWLEPTISRPLMASFEGGTAGFLPLHHEGLELGGTTGIGEGQLDYTLIVSNGRGMTPTDKQKNSDFNDAKAVAGALSWAPGSGAFRTGVAVHFDQIPANTVTMPAIPELADDVDEMVATAFLETSLGPIDLLGEFAAMTNETTADGAEYDHTAGYLQLLLPFENWSPYLRFDVKAMDEGDPYLAQSGKDLDQWRQTIGVRLDFASQAALKLEVGFGERDLRDSGGMISEDDFTVAALQLSFAI